MKILIGTVGTRGDVQPCIALGQGLRAAGHAVTVGTHTDYRAVVESRGLAFRPVGGSFKALVQSDEGRAWVESGDDPRRYREHLDRLFAPLQDGWLADADGAVEGHDAVVYYPMAVHFLHAAERRGLPIVAAPFIPWVPSAELLPVILPGWWPSLRLVNRAVGALLMKLILRPLEPIHARHRARHGLPSVARDGLLGYAHARGVPHVHLFSEVLLPRPTDWPESASVAGFCFLDEPSFTPPAPLAAFLDAGPPPVCVGFGSMSGLDPEGATHLVVEAVRRAKKRAVLLGGWGGLAAQPSSDDILFVDDVPHDWLLPRVSTFVHHGGVGTTAAGLRAGKPAVVIPFFADQPAWARRVVALGAGPAPIPRRKLTVERLADALERADAPGIVEAAARLGERIRAEDGVGTAVRTVLRHLERQRDAGPRG